MHKALLSAGLVSGLLGGGCRQAQQLLRPLPAPTQDGRNTAGFQLNGRSWVPMRSSISTTAPVSGSWRKTKSGHSLTLGFRQFSVQEDWGVAFSLADIRQAGTFLLNQSPTLTNGLNNAAYGQYYHLRPGPRLNYYTGPQALGQLVVTRFDTIHDIISGTFELRPRQDGDTATVRITRGRFDVHFTR